MKKTEKEFPTLLYIFLGILHNGLIWALTYMLQNSIHYHILRWHAFAAILLIVTFGSLIRMSVIFVKEQFSTGYIEEVRS